MMKFQVDVTAAAQEGMWQGDRVAPASPTGMELTLTRRPSMDGRAHHNEI